jgi:hypothetical protein
MAKDHFPDCQDILCRRHRRQGISEGTECTKYCSTTLQRNMYKKYPCFVTDEMESSRSERDGNRIGSSEEGIHIGVEWTFLQRKHITPIPLYRDCRGRDGVGVEECSGRVQVERGALLYSDWWLSGGWCMGSRDNVTLHVEAETLLRTTKSPLTRVFSIIVRSRRRIPQSMA